MEISMKEQALAGIIDKLARSRSIQDAMEPENPPPQAPEESGDVETVMEFSYVHTPPQGGRLNSMELASEGYLPWNPRVILAHRSGSLALVTMTFQYVQAYGRGETWACTKLRAELMESSHDALKEAICDLQGPLPHGVRYMRI